MQPSAPSEPLRWDTAEQPRVLRAADDIGLYIISLEPSGTYRVGYVPSPGPVVEWASGLAGLQEAKQQAEACRQHNREIYRDNG